jgi:hypothetical protein
VPHYFAQTSNTGDFIMTTALNSDFRDAPTASASSLAKSAIPALAGRILIAPIFCDAFRCDTRAAPFEGLGHGIPANMGPLGRCHAGEPGAPPDSGGPTPAQTQRALAAWGATRRKGLRNDAKGGFGRLGWRAVLSVMRH